MKYLKKNRWVVRMGIIIVFASLFSACYLFNILGFREAIKQKESSARVIKITAEPAKDVPTAFNNGDFDGILAFIASKSNEFNWVLERGDTDIMFIDSIDTIEGKPLIMERMGVSFLRRDSTICTTVGQEICGKLDMNKHHILLPSKIKSLQPYSNLPILVHELRHIHQFENKTRKNCIDDEIDAYTWELKFWATISDEEKQHIDGYDDREVIAGDKRLELYNNGQITNWVNELYKDVCK